ncbi:protein EFFECTOR OF TRANSCRIPTION 2, partial [Quillaja saponaria]
VWAHWSLHSISNVLKDVTQRSVTRRHEPIMVAGNPFVVAPRTKREECKRTQHDSNFSKWKILVGPSDWEHYAKGKEGSERYRVHNLPKNSGAGVYELGIAVSRTGLGREVDKLDPKRIVVVYLGEADNVRTRLQHYGRTGSHLGNSYLADYPNDCRAFSLQKGQGLFEEIFARGYSIVYRWAPMENKKDAQQTEIKLLTTFDYAWNTTNNGARRPDDIFHKLNNIASSTARFSNIAKLFLPFTQKQVGVRIKSRNLLPPENELCADADEDGYNILSRVFKFNRSRPRLVLDRTGIIEENAYICGVALSDGSICGSPPVKGRKRCSKHRGMRIKGSITEGKSECILDSNGGEIDGHSETSLSHVTEELPQTIVVRLPIVENFSAMCGIILNDGSPCRRQPVKGRKRCDEHKGRRVHLPISESITNEYSQSVKDVISKSSAYDALDSRLGNNFNL